MTDTNGWPDPSRPGYPLHPERDGWHWLMIGHGVGHPFPMLWCADGEMWEAGDDGYVDAADISTRWNYISPCYTQADLDAAVAKARREGMEGERKAWAAMWAHHRNPVAFSEAMQKHIAIRSAAAGEEGKP